MSRTWVCADHHFQHRNIVKFTRKDGTKLRPFDTIEEHDETIIARHNSVVHPDDRVYCLGDFGNPRIAERLLGRLVLVKGNHDTEKPSKYSAFDDIRACVVKEGLIMSHIPIHPGSMERWQINIHGHLHDQYVAKAETWEPDERYVCVSLEHTDYRPVDLDGIIKKYIKM